MGLILSLVVALVAVAGLSAGAIALGRVGSNAERRRRLLLLPQLSALGIFRLSRRFAMVAL